jgi:hypothetical protein
VAWIAERKNVLSGLFALLAALAWLRYLNDENRGALLLTAAASVAALLSKTSVVALPLILFLLAWWKQPDRWERRVRPLIPLVGLALAVAALAVALEPTATQSTVPMPALRPTERVEIAGRASWFYAPTLAWPSILMAIHGHGALHASALAAGASAVAAAALPLACWSLRAHRAGALRGARLVHHAPRSGAPPGRLQLHPLRLCRGSPPVPRQHPAHRPRRRRHRARPRPARVARAETVVRGAGGAGHRRRRAGRPELAARHRASHRGSPLA